VRGYAIILSIILSVGSFCRADYSIIGHPSDFEARVALDATGPNGDYDPSNSITNSSLRVGLSGGSNNRVYGNAILFFKLPVLQTNETLTAANFRVTELADPANGPPAINADLWAIGYDNRTLPANGPLESQSYLFNGPLDPNPGVGAGATRSLIQNNFLTPTDVINTGGAPISHDTNPAADTALLAYIQNLYANPNIIPGATSLILRLNYDDATYAPTFGTPVNHYTIASAENVSNKPTLTLTTQLVPEPQFITICVSALLLMSRRLKR